MILLGLRTSVKGDLKCSSAELVYGQQLKIPGELVVPKHNNADIGTTLQELRKHFSHVRSKIIHHNIDKPYMPKTLDTCKYVIIIRNNKNTLQPPYEGPFKVISRYQKNVTIEYGNNTKNLILTK